MSGRPLGRLWAACAALGMLGCYSKTAAGTSLVIEADFDPSLGINQLTFSGSDSSGSLFSSTLPPQAGGNLSGAQTVRVLLKNMDDQVAVQVLGLSSGNVAAFGQGQAAVTNGQEADLKVSLSAGSPPDAGICPTGLQFAGQACTGKWCWEYPQPESNFLSGIWVSNDCSVFAVGANGAILQKSGTTWSFPQSSVLELLTSVWGTSASDVWAVGDCDAKLHWDGNAWTLVQAPNCTAPTGRVLLTGVYGTATDSVWTVGYNGAAGVIEYWDGGTWQPVGLNGPPPFTSVWFSGPSDGWAVGAGGKIWHFSSSNGWQGYGSPTTEPLYGVFGFDAGDAWAVGGADSGIAVGTQGLFIRLDGTQWTTTLPSPPSSSSLTVPLFAGWGTSSENLVAVGADTKNAGNAAFLSGTSWSAEPLPYVHGVSGTPDGTAWISGTGGVVYRGGLNSVGLELPTNLNNVAGPATFNAVTVGTVASTTDAWAFGSGGFVLHRQADAGWSTYPAPPNSPTLQAAWEFSPTDVWVAGANSELVHTQGAGTWDAPLSYSHNGPPWFGLSGKLTTGATPTQELWLVGQDLAMERVGLAAAGPTISPCAVTGFDAGVDAGAVNFRGVWATTSPTFAVGDQGLIVKHEGLNGTPPLVCNVVQFGGPDLKGIWGSSPTDLWAVGNAGTVLHSTSLLGYTWTPIMLPSNATDNLQAVAGSVQGGREQVWVTGTNGATYVFDSATMSFTRINFGSGNTTYGIVMLGTNDGYAVGQYNQILHLSP